MDVPLNQPNNKKQKKIGTLVHGQGTNFSLDAVRDAGTICNGTKIIALPTWEDLFAGVRPPAPNTHDDTIGEWTHGWQYHASNSGEVAAFDRLMCVLGFPHH